MRKIFKFLAGGGEWFPYPTIDNTGASSIMFLTLTSLLLPNYRTAALQANNTFTGKISLDRDTFRSLMTRGSNPFTEITDDKGVVDYNPSPYTEKEILPSKFGTTMQKVGLISSAVSSYIPKKPLPGLTTGLDSGFDAATLAVSMFNPVVGSFMAAGGAAVDLMRLAGFGTDKVTFADQVLDSKPLALTPLGLINGFTAKKALNLMGGVDYNNMRADMGAGYGGLSFRLNNAEKYAGKKIGNVFGLRNSANREVYKGNYELSKFEKVYNLGLIYRDIQGTQSDMAFNKENLRMKGGWDDGAISFGRRGMIINPQRMRMIRHITQSYKPLVYTETELSEEEVVQFKNGGSFNLIPEGALHARLHHMENTDGLTKKGIPVVAEKDGGEVELQAEIELNEIIFRLEVTNEIEKLMNDGSDNAAIECGKMLVKEIFENTDDRTGLIEALEEPKEDQGSVVKEHRVFQEGGKMEEDIRQRLIKEWPALSNILFHLVPDSTFTSDKTGMGSIEYFAPDEEDEMSYPNGYKHKNPHKGEASIVYDPASNDYEDIKMDLLHALRVQDPKYRALVELLDSVVLNGDDDLSFNARLRYNEDYKKLGKEYMPFKNYVSNEVDGLLRNLFYNASPEVLHKKRYYPNKEELRKWNEHLLPYIEKIQKYLQGND